MEIVQQHFVVVLVPSVKKHVKWNSEVEHHHRSLNVISRCFLLYSGINPVVAQQPYGNAPVMQQPYGNAPMMQQPYGNSPAMQQPYGNSPTMQQPGMELKN